MALNPNAKIEQLMYTAGNSVKSNGSFSVYAESSGIDENIQSRSEIVRLISELHNLDEYSLGERVDRERKLKEGAKPSGLFKKTYKDSDYEIEERVIRHPVRILREYDSLISQEVRDTTAYYDKIIKRFGTELTPEEEAEMSEYEARSEINKHSFNRTYYAEAGTPGPAFERYEDSILKHYNMDRETFQSATDIKRPYRIGARVLSDGRLAVVKTSYIGKVYGLDDRSGNFFGHAYIFPVGTKLEDIDIDALEFKSELSIEDLGKDISDRVRLTLPTKTASELKAVKTPTQEVQSSQVQSIPEIIIEPENIPQADGVVRRPTFDAQFPQDFYSENFTNVQDLTSKQQTKEEKSEQGLNVTQKEFPIARNIPLDTPAKSDVIEEGFSNNPLQNQRPEEKQIIPEQHVEQRFVTEQPEQSFSNSTNPLLDDVPTQEQLSQPSPKHGYQVLLEMREFLARHSQNNSIILSNGNYHPSVVQQYQKVIKALDEIWLNKIQNEELEIKRKNGTTKAYSDDFVAKHRNIISQIMDELENEHENLNINHFVVATYFPSRDELNTMDGDLLVRKYNQMIAHTRNLSVVNSLLDEYVNKQSRIEKFQNQLKEHDGPVKKFFKDLNKAMFSPWNDSPLLKMARGEMPIPKDTQLKNIEYLISAFENLESKSEKQPIRRAQQNLTSQPVNPENWELKDEGNMPTIDYEYQETGDAVSPKDVKNHFSNITTTYEDGSVKPISIEELEDQSKFNLMKEYPTCTYVDDTPKNGQTKFEKEGYRDAGYVATGVTDDPRPVTKTVKIYESINNPGEFLYGNEQFSASIDPYTDRQVRQQISAAKNKNYGEIVLEHSETDTKYPFRYKVVLDGQDGKQPVLSFVSSELVADSKKGLVSRKQELYNERLSQDDAAIYQGFLDESDGFNYDYNFGEGVSSINPDAQAFESGFGEARIEEPKPVEKVPPKELPKEQPKELPKVQLKPEISDAYIYSELKRKEFDKYFEMRKKRSGRILNIDEERESFYAQATPDEGGQLQPSEWVQTYRGYLESDDVNLANQLASENQKEYKKFKEKNQLVDENIAKYRFLVEQKTNERIKALKSKGENVPIFDNRIPENSGQKGIHAEYVMSDDEQEAIDSFINADTDTIISDNKLFNNNEKEFKNLGEQPQISEIPKSKDQSITKLKGLINELREKTTEALTQGANQISEIPKAEPKLDIVDDNTAIDSTANLNQSTQQLQQLPQGIETLAGDCMWKDIFDKVGSMKNKDGKPYIGSINLEILKLTTRDANSQKYDAKIESKMKEIIITSYENFYLRELFEVKNITRLPEGKKGAELIQKAKKLAQQDFAQMEWDNLTIRGKARLTLYELAQGKFNPNFGRELNEDDMIPDDHARDSLFYRALVKSGMEFDMLAYEEKIKQQLEEQIKGEDALVKPDNINLDPNNIDPSKFTEVEMKGLDGKPVKVHKITINGKEIYMTPDHQSILGISNITAVPESKLNREFGEISMDEINKEITRETYQSKELSQLLARPQSLKVTYDRDSM